MPADTVTMDKIVALCKRRGMIFAASEIYGGIANTYDYGHYGVLLKNNVKAAWWQAMVGRRDDIVALDSAIIQNPRTWEASGHLGNFTDPLVQCLGECKKRFRLDHLQEEAVDAGEDPALVRCPNCGGELSEPRAFNLMFQTEIGTVADTANTVYLRPETAQGIFLDFKAALQWARKKPPFGIAQIGKSFRNEITPGNFIFRMLEFEQMEMEFFVPPETADEWYAYWCDERRGWYERLGIRPQKLRLRAHAPEELSHYSSQTSDVEYEFPDIGFSELEGVADRGNFDLTQHAKHSGQTLTFKDANEGVEFVPHVIEPAAGVDRAVLAFLCDAYDEDDLGEGSRVVLRLHPALAPIKVAVFPLLRKAGHPELAREVYEQLRDRVSAEYDEGGHIGKRYRRHDEIGTPFNVTIDHQSTEDQTVTLRDRDSGEQTRVPIEGLADELARRVAAPWTSPKSA